MWNAQRKLQRSFVITYLAHRTSRRYEDEYLFRPEQHPYHEAKVSENPSARIVTSLVSIASHVDFATRERSMRIRLLTTRQEAIRKIKICTHSVGAAHSSVRSKQFYDRK